MSPRMQGRHALLQMLRAEGVEYIFGNPGTSEAAIMDIIGQYPELKYVLAVQEGVAIGMAEAYTRATHKVSFVSLHIDNGLGNAFALLVDSKKSGTPMVVTAGNKDVRKLAEGRTDLTEMAKPYTKWSVEITHPEQYPSAIRRAFNEARTPPTGPVFVAFSGNSLDDEAEVEIVPSKRQYVEPAPDPAAVEKAAELLAAAKSPVMVVGDRISQYGGMQDAVRLAERIGARVYGHGGMDLNFPTNHPQWLGSLSLRQPAARAALRSADVVFAVGCPVFSDFFYQPGQALDPKTKLIHMDMAPGEIGKSEPTDVGILASPRHGLREIERSVTARMDGAAIENARGRASAIRTETARADEAFHTAAKAAASKRPISPAVLSAELAKHWPKNAVMLDESITTRGPLLQAMRFSEPGSFMGAGGGAIGWGMGMALGLQLACPDRPVVAVVGDGSAMMSIQGLWTAAAYKLPVVFVICNNASYRVLKANMQVYRRLSNSGESGFHSSFDYNHVPFDMASIARGFGVEGVRIEDPALIGPELKKAVSNRQPTVLDVILDGSV